MVLLDLAQQHLDAAGVQAHKVVEGEHQLLDALGGFAVAFLERRHETVFRVAIQVVEDVGHQFVAVAPRGARQVGHEL